MRGRRYELASTWRVAAPLDRTWAFLTDPGQRWDDWWPNLESIDVRRTTDLVGSVAACRWRSPGGYALTFTLVLAEVDPGRLVVLDVDGDLLGQSAVRFTHDGDGSRLDIDLRVRTTRAWMNVAGVVLHPLFRFGHRVVMRRGERGLSRVLAPGLDEPTPGGLAP
ncbi:SRPBCC family protein [Jiangella asiatica]|uniref:Polyketide cyclase n=1 Tax=Jiangella asiatica TaxID=2530372 RepID=A0A4R5DMW3_9ACTN|nr:SRPBCC family protein [Jiangella asiatica]TDE13444.1 hypothetical protein E1269_05255 [Jiangella asiatica]